MKLSIKEPCHENWDAMKIGMISRHCDVCEKNVMDFTNSSRAEIITYILSNRNDSTCGRMRRDQFEFHHEDIPILVEVLKQQPRNHAFLILALVSLSLTSCAQETTIETPHPTPVEHPIMGKIAPPQPDTSKTVCEPTEPNRHELLGEVVVSKGMIEPVEPIQGDIGIEVIPDQNESKALQYAEKMPEYATGIEGLFSYIQDYFKSKKITVKGSAYVRFIVDKEGRVLEPSILKIDPELSYLSKDILQMVNKMPKWIPGENDGKKVNVYYTIPVRFQ